MRIIMSQPSFMPRFSAAMDGWRIQACNRLTDSSWGFSISARMASRSLAGAAPLAQAGRADVAAPAVAVAAAGWREGGRSEGKGTVEEVVLFVSRSAPMGSRLEIER